MGDYARDTGHLSLAEHGAYTVLLDHYYSLQRPLPARLDALHRICRATTKQEQQAVTAVADEFFPVAEDGLRHNAKADRIIAQWVAKAERNREVGKQGGRPKRNPRDNPEENPNGFPEETQTVSENEVSETHGKPSPTPAPETIPRSQKPELAHASSSRAREAADYFESFTRLKAAYPAGTYLESDWLYAERDILARLDEGHTWEEFFAGCDRYRAQLIAKGKLGSEYVYSPKNFFTQREHRFTEPFPLPATKADARLAGNLAAMQEFLNS